MRATDGKCLVTEEGRALLSNLGEMLQQLRAIEGLTQREAAKLADSTQARLCDLELGKGDPAITTIQKWARAYGYDLTLSFVPRGD